MPGAFTVAIQELQELLGERLETSSSVRQHHAHDESFHLPASPEAVAFPKSTSEVSEIARICMRHHMPMLPFGTGTAMEGGVNASHGGLSIDMSLMNNILSVTSEDMDCTVQAGVTRKQLNEHLRDQGMFFPIDPGADASVGGMAATRASGTNAVRYGTMRDAVLALTVVMADGKIVKTSSRARKSAAGYDLTRLFIGSEGTLGIICEISLRLHAIPEAISAAVCAFGSVEGAINTVIETIQMGVPIARIELLDAAAINAVNQYSGTDYPFLPHLFLEFHGTQAWVAEQASIVKELAVENQGSEFQWASNTEDRTALWQARHDFAYAARATRPNARIFSTDVCVPISQLAQCILETITDIKSMPMSMPIVGHVGDGNFHVVPAVDPENEAEMLLIDSFHTRLIHRALSAGGTCTGEHGIGQGKKAFLAEELPAGVDIMKTIKHALDPDNLMNPGKVVDIN
ncbi:FAD-binding oxidoreductase [Neptunomonas japonica]|uniref:D-lactate dehydrogenase (cytochrome) n=1 Tax=Neptunomonas japonica JAMM 1380 TaxID=1441457 RepID=A0A7R6SXR3_9GAMM|nr:FAD-linked oxidase C-terminal domain-containing protein [Neptunomonas japonica]BBB31095.1 D-lactate dehydrogenase [Neptunomonas japonica JAMM 1380]